MDTLSRQDAIPHHRDEQVHRLAVDVDDYDGNDGGDYDEYNDGVLSS